MELTWDDMNLSSNLLRGIYAYGFEKPSAIQSLSCGHLINGKDILAQAQSGTGKTGAFVIGTLARIDPQVSKTQAIILSPTRELALQTTDVAIELSNMMNINIKSLIGGTIVNINDLKTTPPHFVVGTPGRIAEMLHKRVIQPSHIKIIVLDEADELFSFGFKDQVLDIISKLNKDIQIALFSATISSHITTSSILKDPIKIILEPEKLVLDGISQYYVTVLDDKEKFLVLKDLFGKFDVCQTIIYCNSVERVAELGEAMKAEGYPICCIHSNMDKYARSTTFNEFKAGKFRVLISSNITARGIDIQQVSIVINFDLPKDPDIYLHRIGRSGRWGRKGIGINFITKYDVQYVKMIEAHYDKQMEELPIHFDESLK
uniref:Helicase n=1 Tax=viral metagenome TaxID=1070528 RepID=A0A6C0HTI8_9ZZZZ